MEIYHILITVTLFLLFLNCLWNLYILTEREYKLPSDSKLPFVSVLIPARNEEHNIERILKSLVNQDYPKYEIIVLDDNSEDNTYNIAKSLSEKYPVINVIKGKTLEKGWTGKAFACQQLFEKSKGEYLLFTDADTVHHKCSIRKAVEIALNEKSDLLSLMPQMIMKSFWEKIIMPMLYFTVMLLLPFYFVNYTKLEKFSIGIGPFMLFRRESYIKIGGHESVKSAMVEDVWLARKIKKAEMKLTVKDGSQMLGVRMYRNFREIWEGFSKNIFAGFNYSSAILLIINSLYMMLFFMPFIFFFIELIWCHVSHILYLLAIQISLIILSQLLISYRFSLGLAPVFAHPLGTLSVFLISLNSLFWVKSKRGAKWKGRTYK